MDTNHSPRKVQRNRIESGLVAVRQGESQSLGEILLLYFPYLATIAAEKMKSALRPKEGASDIVQEVLLVAQKRFTEFRGTSEPELRQWLRQILLNKVREFHRRYERTEKRAAPGEQSLEDARLQQWQKLLKATDRDCPAMALDRKLRLEQIERAISRLPEQYRQVIEWHSRDGRTFIEIGSTVGRSADAVRMLWNRAITQLRQLLSTE